MPGPRLEPLVLTGGERNALEALARKRTAPQALAGRARIVLACAEDGASVTGVAGQFGVSREMVRKCGPPGIPVLRSGPGWESLIWLRDSFGWGHGRGNAVVRVW